MVELMGVPKETVYSLDKQYVAEQIMDEFFLNTKEYILNLCPNYHPLDLEIQFRDIAPLKNKTKDKLAYLVLNHKEQIIAGVLCTEIKSNNFCYTFFRDLSFLEKDSFYCK